MADTRRIVVDINPKLHAKFTRVVNEIGSKKKFALVKMIEDFVLNAEANPSYFKWLKSKREGTLHE
jgi:hypothetical protein